MDRQKTRPRRLGVAIPSLLVVTTLGNVLILAWVEVCLRECRTQDAAVEALEGLGGRVEYDYQRYPTLPSPRWRSPLFLYATPWWRRWLAVVTGCEYQFATVAQVHFPAMTDADWKYFCGAFASADDVRVFCPINDGQLRFLARMRDLEDLEITVEDEKASITGEGFVHLVGLRRLKGLTLRGVRLTSPGKKALGKLESLEWLSIHDEADDETVANLANLHRLTILGLIDTNITNAGLFHLRKVPSLYCLRLQNTRIGDDGLRHLVGLNIIDLHLQRTDVTDRGIAYVALMPKLSSLDLQDTAVTDAAIPDLEKLKQLHNLYLRGTRVSVAGCQKLHAALPKLSLQMPDGDSLPAKDTEGETKEIRAPIPRPQVEAGKR